MKGYMMTSSRLHSSLEAILCIGAVAMFGKERGASLFARVPIPQTRFPPRNSRPSEKRRTIFNPRDNIASVSPTWESKDRRCKGDAGRRGSLWGLGCGTWGATWALISQPGPLRSLL
jgi:hypothetical protein